EVVSEWDASLISLDSRKDRAIELMKPYISETASDQRSDLVKSIKATAKAFSVSSLCTILIDDMKTINREFDDTWFRASVIKEIMKSMSLTIINKKTSDPMSDADFKIVINSIRSS